MSGAVMPAGGNAHIRLGRVRQRLLGSVAGQSLVVALASAQKIEVHPSVAAFLPSRSYSAILKIHRVLQQVGKFIDR